MKVKEYNENIHIQNISHTSQQSSLRELDGGGLLPESSNFGGRQGALLIQSARRVHVIPEEGVELQFHLFQLLDLLPQLPAVHFDGAFLEDVLGELLQNDEVLFSGVLVENSVQLFAEFLFLCTSRTNIAEVYQNSEDELSDETGEHFQSANPLQQFISLL